MPSFWKRIELTKNLLSVLCSQPAMYQLGLKISKEPIKFKLVAQKRNFLIESEQTFRLATMVRAVALEKHHDARFRLDVGMLNTLADAMLFGFDNQNLSMIKPSQRGLHFTENKLTAIKDDCKTPTFSEITAARLAGNNVLTTLFMDIGATLPELDHRVSSKTTAVSLCLEQFAKICFGSKHASDYAMPNHEFCIFMAHLEELLQAGATPSYMEQTPAICNYPGSVGEASFFSACEFSVLNHEKYPQMFKQIADILALLIRYGASIPDKRKAPFKNMSAANFEMLNISIIIAHNQQNPIQSVISLHEMPAQKTKKRKRLN